MARRQWTFQRELRWYAKHSKGSAQINIGCKTLFSGAVCEIWMERNYRKHQCKHRDVDAIVKTIQITACIRATANVASCNGLVRLI